LPCDERTMIVAAFGGAGFLALYRIPKPDLW